MKTIYYKFLSCLLFISLTSQAQEKPKITLVNDTAYADRKVQFVAKTKTAKTKDGDASIATFLSVDGKIQAMMVMRTADDTTKFSAKFPTLQVGYECSYPAITTFTMVESYIVNKIMVNGIASKEGLEAYCKERKVDLHELTKIGVQKPGMDPKRDSLLAVRAKERAEKQFKLNVINKSAAEVNIFLGDTTASRRNAKDNEVPFRQGRYEKIGKGEQKDLTAFEGEFICITDSLHKIYDIRQLKKTMKPVTVKKNGTSFD